MKAVRMLAVGHGTKASRGRSRRVQQTIGKRLRRPAQQVKIIARDEQTVRKPPARERSLQHRDGGRTLERGRPRQMGRGGQSAGCRRAQTINFCTACQTSWEIFSSDWVPSTTWKRSGRLRASKR